MSRFFLFFVVLLLSAACNRSKDEPSFTEDKEKPLELCSLPKSLKQAILQKLKNIAQNSKAETSSTQADRPTVDCKSVTKKDLAKIKHLKITNISYSEKTQAKKYNVPLNNLQSLDLSGNKEMSVLPGFVYSLTSLKTLNISKTGVSNLHGNMCQLKNLEELKASHNNYEGQEVPIAIFCLNSLKVLDLSHSKLRYIDEYIFYLKKLERLYLQGNELTILPMVFAVMSHFLVLDLRDNDFEHAPANTLHDCSKTAENSEERKECQHNITQTAGCEYWHKYPFERGSPFRDRFRQMTGEPYKSRKDCVECNHCYNFWIQNYVSFGVADDPKHLSPDELAFTEGPERTDYLKKKWNYLLDLTINGKTMREWRLANDELIKLDIVNLTKSTKSFFLYILPIGCPFEAKGIGGRNTWYNSIYHFFLPRELAHGTMGNEVHSERAYTPGWTEKDKPERCSPIDYTVPIPASHGGPWSSALDLVQSTINKTNPPLKSCKEWPTGHCQEEENEKADD